MKLEKLNTGFVYWKEAGFITYDYGMLLREIEEIINILTAIVKTSQQKNYKL